MVWMRPRLIPLKRFWRLGAFVGLPDVEELLVAGGGEVDSALTSGAAEGGPDIFFGVRQFGERDLQGRAWSEPAYVLEKLRDDLFVLAIAALGYVDLKDRFELQWFQQEFRVIRFTHDLVLSYGLIFF
jgi:hypothetical protein